MSTIKYFVTLKPLTPFFFGGENTFGEGAETNYFVRSNYLPQQTTLLGFLRYELLFQNNLIGTNPFEAKWEELIGPSSFCIQNEEFTSDFGAIKKISPAFLSNDSEHYICQSFDWGTVEKENSNGLKAEQLFPLQYASSVFKGNISAGNSAGQIPALKANNEDFTQKNGTRSLWVSADGRNMRQWDYEDGFEKGRGFENGFFIAQSQIGIFRKIKRTKEDTGDFYKIISYSLADNFAFAFFADIELPAGKTFGSRIVTMGGERSVFEMKALKAQAGFEDMFTAITFNANRTDSRRAIVLMSDTYTKDDIGQLCNFAITDSIPFRNITSSQGQNASYAKISGGALTKTQDLIYLLRRGSIFYTEEPDQLKESFTNPAFHKIGYNHFIEL